MILQKIEDYFSYNRPFRLVIVGKRGVGKSTFINAFLKNYSFNLYSIDLYRHHFSDGSLDGEEYAYFNFLRDIKLDKYENQIIECTGLGKRFPALFSKTHANYTVMLYCSEAERKSRILNRNRAGYKNPPFPYQIGKDKNFEWHVDQFVNVTFNDFNFDSIMGGMWNKLDYIQHNENFISLDRHFDQILRKNRNL